MKKKRLISLTLALSLSAGLLTGCSKENDETQAHVSGDPESVVITDTERYESSLPVVDESTNQIIGYESAPQKKEFEPGTHIIMLRYDLLESLGYSNAESINSLNIEIPEGYQVLDIENFDGLGYKIGTVQTYGVDIWLINNEKVLVQPVYNKIFGKYDYSQPGSVVNELENDSVIKDKRY